MARKDYSVTIDLTARLCTMCVIPLSDGPKFRYGGHLLCDYCAKEQVSMLTTALDKLYRDGRSHLEPIQALTRQYVWDSCFVCNDSDDLCFTKCGHAVCLTCQQNVHRCGYCRKDIGGRNEFEKYVPKVITILVLNDEEN
ncbi:hypothetical protein AU210_016426 [Fusarium oxysporum f. sp. radicis-cucumerinum]|uniref:RING-type domain-containing protein n=1 Tax=Fusarium oxysporum f. sp. radicis-cucumerinum TaxID=327505 RepID=A0A2H3G2Z2_FUSOX|nr:hypothetical protein AU210_016426 [Fusarium oxysporum f. sp. radicis-cucumerinum]